MTNTASIEEQAVSYHLTLPLRIYRYLNRRGITDPVIERFLLGWNGKRITIPLRDREGKVAFFRLAKDPENRGRGPKMLSEPGSSVELYGWEWLKIKPTQLVICEGEFDRLVLERHGIPAVTSTAGAGVFKKGWVETFRRIQEIYVCFDRDEAGRNGALRVARMIPGARIVKLPEEVGKGGDVTDYFVRLGRGREDFLCLLKNARPAPKPETRTRKAPRTKREPGKPNEVEELKAKIEIADVIQPYTHLRGNGRALTGRCPFHEDQNPSFAVYPESQSFYCFGCHEHGDVLDFLMKAEGVSFPEALDVLRKLAT